MPAPLIFRHSRIRLRSDIIGILLERPSTPPELSQLLDLRLVTVRAELFVLRAHRIIEPVAIATEDDGQATNTDRYYWDYYWDLTTHGRHHHTYDPIIGCRGCAIRHRYDTSWVMYWYPGGGVSDNPHDRDPPF
jgi:hypothetical protein